MSRRLIYLSSPVEIRRKYPNSSCPPTYILPVMVSSSTDLTTVWPGSLNSDHLPAENTRSPSLLAIYT
ncbi:MAG: hypothetical protein IPP49_04865 [Saprospiraceae bacterium]|nr:hypothetical protein [Saprospiraceae bacterium]